MTAADLGAAGLDGVAGVVARYQPPQFMERPAVRPADVGRRASAGADRGMVMVQPWIGFVSAAAAVVVGLAVVWTSVQRRRRRPGSDEVAIANVHRADASPVFRRLRRRYHLLLGGEVAALSIVGLAAVGLTMRPVTDRQLERDVRNRDVMLCLDVSTSMNELDAIVLREFVKLAAGSARRTHRADDLQRLGDHRVPAHRRRRVHRHPRSDEAAPPSADASARSSRAPRKAVARR